METNPDALNSKFFDYTGDVQSYTVPSTGTYRLQVWGAQGGYSQNNKAGGYGGYSSGTISLTAGQTIYVVVGGRGGKGQNNTSTAGGYNGGGTGSHYSDTGGGGGLYGGGALNGGAGGSGYIDGVNNGTMESGIKPGNGCAIITPISTSTQATPAGLRSKFFDYTGGIQTFTAPKAGTYKLEVWGAYGGKSNKSRPGGLGGYSTGNVTLTAGQTIYVVVGGAGANGTANTNAGGYNGGGQGTAYSDKGSGGGGATHIGTFNSTLSARGSTSGLYIVAGGGGGAYGSGSNNIGGTGGGSSGGNGGQKGYGGTQSTGGTGENANGAFGQGGNSPSGQGTAGGGGGLYGGGDGYGGGGGSGYIGGVTSGSTSNGIKMGNGAARITIPE